MNNRQMLTELIDAFDRNDYEGILKHLADDVQWDMVSEFTSVSGKAALRKFFLDHADVKLVSSTKERIILDGDHAAVNGEVLCRNEKTGEEYDMYYADIYDIVDGKVKKMVTYNIMKQK